MWREIGATAFDPVTGLNRFITGDASRISRQARQSSCPATLGGVFSAGALWRGSNTRAIDSAGTPFLEGDLVYGDPTTGRSRTPYDAFAVRLTLGGGAGVSEVRVRGRLMGEPFASDRAQFSVVQSYNFQGNEAYHFGAQSFEATFGLRPMLSDRTSLLVLGWGGLTVLGAVDSLPLGAGRAAAAGSGGRIRGPGRLGGATLLRLRTRDDVRRER